MKSIKSRKTKRIAIIVIMSMVILALSFFCKSTIAGNNYKKINEAIVGVPEEVQKADTSVEVKQTSGSSANKSAEETEETESVLSSTNKKVQTLDDGTVIVTETTVEEKEDGTYQINWLSSTN